MKPKPLDKTKSIYDDPRKSDKNSSKKIIKKKKTLKKNK